MMTNTLFLKRTSSSRTNDLVIIGIVEHSNKFIKIKTMKIEAWGVNNGFINLNITTQNRPLSEVKKDYSLGCKIISKEEYLRLEKDFMNKLAEQQAIQIN